MASHARDPWRGCQRELTVSSERFVHRSAQREGGLLPPTQRDVGRSFADACALAVAQRFVYIRVLTISRVATSDTLPLTGD